MQYFCCDLCGKHLSPGDEARYCVRIDGFAADEETVLEETEADAVDAMDEYLMEQVALEAASEDGDSPEMLPVNTSREYDLCRGCYSKLLSDPLGRQRQQSPRFSRN
ncbi:hypothetical protein BH11PLA2_BH11PLA2_17120 [soil metagenome]